MEKTIKSYDDFKEVVKPDDFSKVTDLKSWFDKGGELTIHLFAIDLSRSSNRFGLSFKDGELRMTQEQRKQYEGLISGWLKDTLKADPNSFNDDNKSDMKTTSANKFFTKFSEYVKEHHKK